MSYNVINSIPDLTAEQIAGAVRIFGEDFTGATNPGLMWSEKSFNLAMQGAGDLKELYAIDAVAGQVFSFKSCANLDPSFRIYDQFGNAILENDESDDGGLITGGFKGLYQYYQDYTPWWVAPYTGTYYVAAGAEFTPGANGLAYRELDIQVHAGPAAETGQHAGPTVSISGFPFESFLTKGQSAMLVLHTSENTYDLTIDDLAVVGGTLSLSPTSIGSPMWPELGGQDYQVTFTPSDGYEGVASISVGNGKFSSGGVFNSDGSDLNNKIEIGVSTVNYASRQFGTAANESFQATSGKDYMNGGDGVDTAVFTGNRAAYAFTKNTDGGLFVDGPAGNRDYLTGVERCSFNDVNLAFDTDGAVSAGGIYRLYQAAFDRTPDQGGLGYWINSADKGMGAVAMAEAFVNSQEFRSLYHVTSTDKYLAGENIDAVVTSIYNHVLHRAPDAGGLSHYAGAISAHERTAGDVLAEISNSPENYAATIGQISGGIAYTPWSVTELYGTNGNDVLLATTGKDYIDGGAGIDTVVFAGVEAGFSIHKYISSLAVTDLGGKEDTLIGVERLKFNDGSLAFDTDGAVSAGGIYRLYQAAFDRTPDQGGLGYWINSADKGMGAVAMAEAFVNSQEFHDLYHVTSTDKYLAGENIDAVVTSIYNHVLHRAPDAGGLSHYAGAISAHERTAGDVLAEISNSPENYVATIGQIDHGIQYDIWVG